jgi:hypothetical protein
MRFALPERPANRKKNLQGQRDLGNTPSRFDPHRPHGGVHFWVTPLLRQRINSPLITPCASVTFFLSQFAQSAGA